MSSRTKVSKQVRVTQGKEAIIFELQPKGLVISYGETYQGGQTATEGTRFVLKVPGVNALRELLGMHQPSIAEAIRSRKEAKDRLTLPPEEFDKRFAEPDQSPPREPDGAPTPEGLTRRADGVEEGMGE